MKQSIQFGSKRIDYVLRFTPRKTLGITVTPEMEVLVNAPLKALPEKVREKVKSKAPWILSKQARFLSYHPRTPERKYISGETHLYLGRQNRLQVTLGIKREVRYKGSSIEVIVPEKSQAPKLLKQWYREQAKRKFTEISERLVGTFHAFRKASPRISIKAMPTRWGSCTAKGEIILNPELIKAPRGCIEYVIIHELCHLVHRNHTPKFMELQAKVMPDWEKWKSKLERLLA